MAPNQDTEYDEYSDLVQLGLKFTGTHTEARDASRGSRAEKRVTILSYHNDLILLPSL